MSTSVSTFSCLTDELKARSPEKFMDASDVKVTDENGFLSCSQTAKANNKIVSKIETQPLDADTDAQLHEYQCSSRGTQFQGVQDCTCECPRSQAGTGKSTHIEIRDVGGTFVHRGGAVHVMCCTHVLTGMCSLVSL